MKRVLLIVVPLLVLGLVGAGLAGWIFLRNGDVPPFWDQLGETETITLTEYHPPPPEAKPLLVDDRLEEKATTFDPGLVDRRPEEGWLVNLSDAVIKLDAPIIKPDVEPGLLVLHPSYTSAIAATRAARASLETILPSVNMIDGKAKQFDDGLVAALVQASLQGKSPKLANHVAVVKRLLDAVGPDSPAAPFLAAGLALIGEKTTLAPAAEQEKARWLRSFEGVVARITLVGSRVCSK